MRRKTVKPAANTDVLEESLKRHAKVMLEEDNVGRQPIRDFVSLAKKWIERAAKHQSQSELSQERFFRLLERVDKLDLDKELVEKSKQRSRANAELLDLRSNEESKPGSI